ncbi:unknown [Clostridium sp. CAG:470]|nr:unknown [Clostridium sp. CAG:470]
MSIINIVKNIKQVHPEHIILIKIGKFYYSYSKDAYIISYIFGYKLKNIEENKINYIIIHRRNNYAVDEKSDNGNLIK